LSDDLEAWLYECLACRRWARAVANGKPVDEAMDELTDEEWLEAMRAHPRIGERGGHAPDVSDREQSEAMRSSAATLADLAAENRRYEKRFGHVFLIAAQGRGADEILAELRRRMKNTPKAELEEAKRELRKITRTRVGRLASA